ncbi:MAG: hypothetical protein H0X17_18285 [Deltaproteobacteria bacterium]|nr:hypothetical protein [Deltaproteobacteria bacterium]
MRSNTLELGMLSLAVAALASAAAGCKSTECGEGTIERAGACVASDVSVSTAKCGPFTELVGDQCVPTFQATVCDPTTTDEDLDIATNVTTCIGTGGGGCGAALACPVPAAGKQTICGQLFDLETGDPFAQVDAAGESCDPMAAAATGPCSVRLQAYDAIAFSNNPNDPSARLATGEVYLDDCGRYRLADITLPAGSPFVAVGIDDVDATKAGPLGTTNAAGIATPKVAGAATKDVEAFVVPRATTDQWAASGGPTINGGIYAMLFRARRAPSKLPRAGVTITKGGAQSPLNDHYFVPTDVTRQNIEPTATATGANGTALVTGAMLADGYSGTGALPADCRWSVHAGATVPFVVFVQILRPLNASASQTCPL